MSRCFPFPPPGYERTLSIDDGNLLAKEKDKEKKEKKHKKDKHREKNEGKDKDKERSKEKHREKDKEKKDKHKHKDKDTKKEKSKSKDEKRFGGESAIVEKAGSNSPRSQLTDSSPLEEFARKNEYVGGATEEQNGDRINGMHVNPWFDQKVKGQRDGSQTWFPTVAIVCNGNGVDKKRNGIVRPVAKEVIANPKEGKEKEKQYRNGEREKTEEAAFVQELGKRIREENGAINTSSQKKADSIRKVVNGSIGNAFSSQRKETSGFGDGIHRKKNEQGTNIESGGIGNAYPSQGNKAISSGNGIYRKENGHGPNGESRGPKVAIVHNFKASEQRGREMVRPLDIGRKLQMANDRAGRNGFGGSGALGDKEKKMQVKDGEKIEARTEEKAMPGSECIIKLSRLGENGSQSTDSFKQNALNASKKAVEGVTKRKEPEANGFLHDDEERPSKLPRLALSPKPGTENGRKLQSSTTITLSAPAQGTTNALKREIKQVNGAQASKEPLLPAKRSCSTTTIANGPMAPLGPTTPQPSPVKPNGTISTTGLPLGLEKAPVKLNGTIGTIGLPLSSEKVPSSSKHKHKDKSSKPPPPHPDTKYLSQILAVPKIDELSGFDDDQEWLFESKGFLSREDTKAGCGTDEGQHSVWAKAVHIESADVFALPFVIPY